MKINLLLPIAIPIITGILLVLDSFREHRQMNEDSIKPTAKQLRILHVITGSVLVVSVVLALICAWGVEQHFELLRILDKVSLYFRNDALSRLFITIISGVWLLAGFYAFVYMKHEQNEKRFYGFYLLVYGVLIALVFSGNLVTMYLFYELMTLTSMPLVLHNGSKEAIMASLKYLFYSMCGAYLGLFGIFFMYRYCDMLTFTEGGTLNMAMAEGHTGILLIAVFAMVVGFGAKAGMIPLHAWLPTAHPVAPTPASAVLSSIIVKCGVLAMIRVVYYVVGPDFIRGTWVHTTWMIMTLATVFMGSLLAYREPVIKKRLAYSTVSQVSYILFGLSILNETAMTGALLHTVYHAVIKCTLFLMAGVWMYRMHITRADEIRDAGKGVSLGKLMPKALWCYTIAALGLIGIPPTSGFISKWYLAQGALEASIGALRWVGPAVLLVSALLTAGYLLPITLQGFMPGKEFSLKKAVKRKEPAPGMLIPLIVLALLVLLLGIFPNTLIEYASRIAAELF